MLDIIFSDIFLTKIIETHFSKSRIISEETPQFIFLRIQRHVPRNFVSSKLIMNFFHDIVKKNRVTDLTIREKSFEWFHRTSSYENFNFVPQDFGQAQEIKILMILERMNEG